MKLWKKSRENKTTKENPITIPKKDSQETLDKKLKKIEEEISKYKEELERIRTEKIKNEERKARKKKKQEHWAMMKWIVNFIDENKENWERSSKQRQEDREIVEQVEQC